MSEKNRTGKCPIAADDFRGFDHHSPNHRDSVEALWARMRDLPNLPHSESYGGFYVVTRHADLRSAAGLHKIYSSADGLALPNEDRTRHIPAEVDPPLQREYRRILDPFLTPDYGARHESMVREIAVELLEGLADESRLDVVSRFTEPFPVFAALAIFGFPRADAARLNDLVERLIHGRGSVAAKQASMDLTDYLVQLLTARADSADPSTDIVAAVAAGRVEGRSLSLDEQVSITRLLLFGGFTTVNLALSSTLNVLARQPQMADALRAAPDLYRTALEEFVRYASPGTYLRRTVTGAAELGGSSLHRGDQLLLCFGAANRDPKVFDRPDELVLDRNPNPHVGFGFGAHRCMGSAIAKLEIRVALEEILNRYERLELDPDRPAVWGQGETQGLTSLPMILKRRGSDSNSNQGRDT